MRDMTEGGHHKRGRQQQQQQQQLYLLWYLLLCLILDLSSAASIVGRGDSSELIRHRRAPQRSYSGREGVKLNSRVKQHGPVEETCPILTYCQCKPRGLGVDITCDKINSYKLKVDCDELKKKERFVRYFKIRNSDIPKLEDHLFMGIKIEHLYIHNSKLRTLSAQSVSSQGESLSHLVLSKNEITEVPSEAIRSLRNLDHLNLNDNNITALRREAFVGLSKVTRLTLYNNGIKRIDPNAFDGVTRFIQPYEGINDRDLTRLNLGKNFIELIPHEALIPLKYLQILDLTENKIASIEEGQFEGMDMLDHLTLNHNRLTHLGSGYFRGLTSLTTLYIDHNNIQTIEADAFEGLEEKLQSLSLTGNQIEAFPSAALRRIHQLETLHMDDNKIKKLDEDAFQGFGEHIKNLWLQHNLIKDIPAPAFQDLHSLEWIKLFNNDLRTLHYELMEPVLDTLMHIDIHSNPLKCDCELRWYRQWIEEEWNEIEEEWLKDTMCEDPADGLEHNIATVPLKDMFCKEDVTDKAPKVKDDGGGAALIMMDATLLTLSLMAAVKQLSF